jgi:membrane protein involved in D-alanine export
MIFMTPYERPLYFIVFAVLVIPIAVSLLKGRNPRVYKSIVTVLFLWIVFGGSNFRQGIAFVCYVAFQTVLCRAYFRYKRSRDAKSSAAASDSVTTSDSASSSAATSASAKTSDSVTTSASSAISSAIVFYAATFLSVLPLIVTKVTPLISADMNLFGFLGISYLTFKSVQMIVEIRDGLIKTYRIGDYVQFLVFFPTISAGPIDRFRRFEKDLIAPPDPARYTEMIGKGIHAVFLGFFYNYILGHLLGATLLSLVEEITTKYGYDLLGAAMYMYVYSLFLFFDFAGYSKFAVGVSYLMGFETPDNFNMPFLSKNIKDFWNRWHMSLSFWFRDFVYMRLMMTLLKKKVFRSRVVASNVAYFALFLLMGVWHGLTWYYVAYGFYHASLICLCDAWQRYRKKRRVGIPSNRFTKIVAVVATFHAVCFSFLIFSGYFERLIA